MARYGKTLTKSVRLTAPPILEKPVALVAGYSGSTAKALCIHLTTQGWNVYGLGDAASPDRTVEAAQNLKNYHGISVRGVKAIHADLGSGESIAKVAKEINPTRIFINKWAKSNSTDSLEKQAHLDRITSALEGADVPVETVDGPFWPWWKPSMA